MKRQNLPEQPTSVTVLPFEGKLGVRECFDPLPWLFPTPSPLGIFGILICPLLVLFGAGIDPKMLPSLLGLCAGDFEVTVRSVSASASSEADNEQSWP